jgi:hypothetical protein
VDGIGPIAPLIAPVDDKGELLPVATRVEGGRLISAWYRGEEKRPVAFELPREVDLFGRHPGWGPLRSGQPGRQASWAWRWSLEMLQYALQDILNGRALPVDAGPIFEAELYAQSLRFLGRGSGVQEPLAVSDLAAKVAKHQEATRRLQVAFRPSPFVVEIDALVKAGVETLKPPSRDAIAPPAPPAGFGARTPMSDCSNGPSPFTQRRSTDTSPSSSTGFRRSHRGWRRRCFCPQCYAEWFNRRAGPSFTRGPRLSGPWSHFPPAKRLGWPSSWDKST